MRLEHYDTEKLKKEILSILGKHLNLSEYRAFFFGSRVNGREDERSDIDVGIEGSRPVPSIAMLEIQEEMENLPTLYKIDLVDFSDVSEKFKKVAKQHIEVIT
ncbi:MAG: nucleotidyltransferase domain-containing protein [Patescibacteria group bacterium]